MFCKYVIYVFALWLFYQRQGNDGTTRATDRHLHSDTAAGK